LIIKPILRGYQIRIMKTITASCSYADIRSGAKIDA
jgi:hypothetical protein